MIVKASKEDGGLRLDHEHDCSYPNHEWKAHVCAWDDTSKTAAQVIHGATHEQKETLERGDNATLDNHEQAALAALAAEIAASAIGNRGILLNEYRSLLECIGIRKRFAAIERELGNLQGLVKKATGAGLR